MFDLKTICIFIRNYMNNVTVKNDPVSEADVACKIGYLF